MSRFKFIVATWLLLMGLWPAVPLSLHDQPGIPTAELLDLVLHFLGGLLIFVMFYDRWKVRA